MANKIIEGVWDCVYCGTDRVRGALRECPNCGHPRDADVRFYIADPRNYVVHPEKINKNPDWICPYCKSLNSDSINVCKSCGSPRSESEEDYFNRKNTQHGERSVPTEVQGFQDDSHTSIFVDDIVLGDNRKEIPAQELDHIASTNIVTRAEIKHRGHSSVAKNSGRVVLRIIAILMAFAFAFLLLPKNKEIRIEDKSWYRSIAIEAYGPVQESSWEALPAGAYSVRSSREIHHYDHVLDHYETKTRQVSEQVFDGYDTYYTTRDLGNGYFEQVEHQTPRYRTEWRTETYQDPVYKDVPVYQMHYYYTIDKWHYDHTEELSGNGDIATDPDYVLGEKERFGNRTEKYWFHVDGAKYEVSSEMWADHAVGETIIAKVWFKKVLRILDDEQTQE